MSTTQQTPSPVERVRHAYKALWPLMFSSILSIAGAGVVRSFVSYEGIGDDVSAWGAFFTVFGVIYAIIAGFLLLDVLGRYGALARTCEAELNAVECIRDFLVYLEANQSEIGIRIRLSLRSYVASVSRTEWPQMCDAAGDTDSDTSEELYALMRVVNEVKVESEADQVVLTALIDKISEITTMRTERICLANTRLPPRLKALLLFMSISLVAGFLLMKVANVYVHFFMAASLAMCVHLLYMIIEDLDHPFYGVWNVSNFGFDQLLVKFENELASGDDEAQCKPR